MFLLKSIIFNGLLIYTISAQTTIEPLEDNVNYRLPNNTHPLTYDLSIYTRIDAFDRHFTGNVKIGIIVDQQTSEIVLNTFQLTIVNVSLSRLCNNTAVPVELLPFEYDDLPEFLKIQTNQSLLSENEQLVLEINYSGTLGENGVGFYESLYMEDDGKIRLLASTKLDPVFARRVFPCYDEPALKAKFKISITHGRRYSAISNMPEQRVDNSDDTATTTFLETPLMSSYLVAFAISDFEYLHVDMNSTHAFRVYSQPSEVESTRLALTNCEPILKAFEEYFQIPFTLPKMDLIAVPGHRSGAMENWGLVTFKEQKLLYNNMTDASSIDFQMGVLGPITHEFAHMWFGNLVTPKWWSWLWLSEGFATLFGFLGMSWVYPDWKIMEIFVSNVYQKALHFDADQFAQPMSNYVEDPHEIRGQFDAVAYLKSASVIHMFLHAIRELTFRKGLNYYLKKHSFQTADESDLFTALDLASKEDKSLDDNLDVASLFQSWSRQPGYPLLTVTRDYEKNITTIKQERYFDFENSLNDTSKWWIPYNYATASNPDFNDTTPNDWLDDNETEKVLNDRFNSNDWVLFNKQQTSFYRILYDDTNYRLLAKQLNGDNFSTVHVSNRAQFLYDLEEFVRTGRVNIEILFEFLSYLRQETEYAPWKAGTSILKKLDIVLGGVDKYNEFRTFASNLTEKFFTHNIKREENENLDRKLARHLALSVACKFNLPACLEFTHDTLFQHLRNNIEISESEDIIHEHGSKIATTDEVEYLWNHSIEMRTIVASVQNQTLLETYLHKTIINDESLGAPWRHTFMVNAISSGQDSLLTAFKFLREHSAEVLKAYRLQNLDFFVWNPEELIVSEDGQKEFDDLITTLMAKKHLSDNFDIETIKQNIRNKLDWVNQHQRGESIEKWFTSLKTAAINNFSVNDV